MRSVFYKIWHFARWPLFVLAAVYAVLVLWDVKRLFDADKTNEVVAAIHAQKMTLADVMGTNLPPPPDVQENNATVAGVDKNNNGVRDDVELAIFKKYPNSARIRAAELQYAMAEQMYFKVINSETWVAAAQEDSRGYACIGQTYPRTNLSAALKVIDSRTKEVEDFVFNTQTRKDSEKQAAKFTTSFSLPNSDLCNVDLTTLPN